MITSVWRAVRGVLAAIRAGRPAVGGQQMVSSPHVPPRPTEPPPPPRARRGHRGGGSIASSVTSWPPEEDEGELLRLQVAHGIYRCPAGCTEHTLERALLDDRVPAVLSPEGTLLTCEATVRARHDQFTGATACCPQHGWSSLIGISFDKDGPRDEWGRPTRWTSAVLECGATLEPVEQD